MRTLAVAGLFGVLACSGPPPGLPGTATCTLGKTERTFACRDICAEAERARGQQDRQDLLDCAEAQCGLTCQ